MKRRAEDPQQLALFPSLAGGGTVDVRISVDYPAAADRKLISRIDAAGRRLSRGAVAADWKLRKLAGELEAIAGLFDGGK